MSVRDPAQITHLSDHLQTTGNTSTITLLKPRTTTSATHNPAYNSLHWCAGMVLASCVPNKLRLHQIGDAETFSRPSIVAVEKSIVQDESLDCCHWPDE